MRRTTAGDNGIFNNSDRILVRLLTYSDMSVVPWPQTFSNIQLWLVIPLFRLKLFIFVYIVFDTILYHFSKSIWARFHSTEQIESCGRSVLENGCETGFYWAEALGNKMLSTYSNHIGKYNERAFFIFDSYASLSHSLFRAGESVCHRFSR